MEVTQKIEAEKDEHASEQYLNSGLMCLVTASRLLGIPADYQQLKRAFMVTDAVDDRITLLRRQKKSV